MQLIFARHGESQANVERIISNRNLPHFLTARGREQALALASGLKEQGIGQIYSSPIPRARETAQIVAERLGVSVSLTDALMEIDCGQMEGRGDREAWEAHDEMLRRWADPGDHDYRIAGGESLNDVKGRFIPFVMQVAASRSRAKSPTLFISHGNTLMHMLPLVLKNYPPEKPLAVCEWVGAVQNDAVLVYQDEAGG